MLSEQMTAYAVQAIAKCQTEGYKSILVKDEAVQSFMKYTDDYFGRTVFTTNCKSSLAFLTHFNFGCKQ